MKKATNGKRLPVGGRNFDLLGFLLTPLRYWDTNTHPWRLVTIRTTREQIEKYLHLWED